jgi:hypothetical protein
MVDWADVELFFQALLVATTLTAFNDNAAITYLATLSLTR